MKALTASDRKSLIKLASSLEKGSDERRAILSGLKKASNLVAIPVPFQTDSGLSWEELGFYEETPEEAEAQSAILKYLGKRDPGSLQAAGGEPGSWEEQALSEAFKKGKKIFSGGESEFWLGSFGRMKAVAQMGYSSVYLV